MEILVTCEKIHSDTRFGLIVKAMYEICREDAINHVKNLALKKMAAFWAELIKMVQVR